MVSMKRTIVTYKLIKIIDQFYDLRDYVCSVAKNPNFFARSGPFSHILPHTGHGDATHMHMYSIRMRMSTSYMYTHIRIYTCTYIHTHMHTHPPTHTPVLQTLQLQCSPTQSTQEWEVHNRMQLELGCNRTKGRPLDGDSRLCYHGHRDRTWRSLGYYIERGSEGRGE